METRAKLGRGVFQGWEEPPDHLGTQGFWESKAAMVQLVKMDPEAYQEIMGSQVKRVKLGLQARGVKQGREGDPDSPAGEGTTPRMLSP